MNSASTMTLNVNPAAATVGSLHPEVYAKFMRRRVDSEGAKIAREKSGAKLRLLFGPTSARRGVSKALLGWRIVFGMALVAYGLFTMSAMPVVSVMALVAGCLSVPGFMSRVSMTVLAVAFAVVSLSAFGNGEIPVVSILLACGSMVTAICGPGCYSADAILRRRIFRSIRRRETHKLMERRFSYRAYELAQMEQFC